MSIIFGFQKPGGQEGHQSELRELAASTACHAENGTHFLTASGIGMGLQASRTTERSQLENQLGEDDFGNILAFDGRLDNYKDLMSSLGIADPETSDSSVILVAFLRWGESCFSRLVGDWALALWSPRNRILHLARDHAGTRSLYFQVRNGILTWSTCLETFFVNGGRCAVDETYCALYLGSQPTRELTPYQGIRSVPPAHFMTFRENMAESHSHWKCMANGHIRYQSDSEYDEHFLFLFKQSIARRTGPGATILAHLSGGVDSTSIVCISDHLRRSANPNPQLIDTLSFYDDSEPNWNEKPFFAIVEAERGKSGIHFPISSMNRTFETPEPSQGKCFFPGADSGLLNQESTLQELLACGHYNVVLSGIGGDELLGGVPNPLPELTDHLLSGDLGLFLNDALAWSLTGRKPLARMLLDTIKFAAGLYLRPQVDNGRIPPWITPHLRSHCVELTPSLDLHKNRLGVPPTALCNSLTWSSIMETLPHSYSSNSSRREFRYPYLDRDLVDFLFSVPSDQLVRPGRRRYLMRRALKDIVPIEILERRRKAFIIRGPLASLQQSRAKINGLFSKSLVAERGLIDPKQFNVAFDAMTIGGDAKWMTSILRTISFELWLRGLQAHAPEVASNKLHGDQIAR